jgi:catechol 2,3-dioxygenase-like lactoylglutathione lyase family enzyme
MFDHLSLGVRDLDAAARFYDALFAPLGHARTWSQERELAYGRAGSRLFWLYPVDGDRIAGLGAHIAFRAESTREVDEAYAAAIAHGATIVRAAGLHTDIGPDYYGAIVLDPDGNKIEIVVGAMH